MKITTKLLKTFKEMGYDIKPEDIKPVEGALPLTVDFDPNKIIGTARIFRRGNDLLCEAQIDETLTKKVGVGDIIKQIENGMTSLRCTLEADKIEMKGCMRIVRGATLTDISVVPVDKKGGNKDGKN